MRPAVYIGPTMTSDEIPERDVNETETSDHIPVEGNGMIKAIHLAENKYRGNVVLKTIVQAIQTQRVIVEINKCAPADGLLGYREGAKGTRGYGFMYSAPQGPFAEVLKEVHALTELSVMVRLLIDSLNALGENLEY